MLPSNKLMLKIMNVVDTKKIDIEIFKKQREDWKEEILRSRILNTLEKDFPGETFVISKKVGRIVYKKNWLEKTAKKIGLKPCEKEDLVLLWAYLISLDQTYWSKLTKIAPCDLFLITDHGDLSLVGGSFPTQFYGNGRLTTPGGLWGSVPLFRTI